MEINLEKMAQEVARRALDETEYKGKTLREWAELLAYFDGGKEKPVPPCEENEPEVLFCGICKSGEYLHNEDGARNTYCGQCGHKIDWAYYDATVEHVERAKRKEELPEHLQKEGGQGMKEWISVEDRLPDIGETVLVFAVAKYSAGSKITTDHLEEGEVCLVWLYTHRWFKVTHWMPLPDAPGERGQG